MTDKEEKQNYFQEALSDFTHDMASGRAIRHLTDLGYTADQIMRELDFPTPRARVVQTMTRHLKEKGILLERLPVPEGTLQEHVLSGCSERQMAETLRRLLVENGEENSYISCPFGLIYRDRQARLERMLAPLTAREKEYIYSIAWDMREMYHRLTPRMAEIGVQLALHTEDTAYRFLFLKTEEVVRVS
jgi:hypothetical protein